MADADNERAGYTAVDGDDSGSLGLGLGRCRLVEIVAFAVAAAVAVVVVAPLDAEAAMKSHRRRAAFRSQQLASRSSCA